MNRFWICVFLYTIGTYTAPPQGMAPHAIICFCKPAVHLQADAPRSVEVTFEPGGMSKQILDTQIQKYSTHGVIGAYHGYVALSDHNGQLLFPRKHTSDEIYYVITRSIAPKMGKNDTVQKFYVTKPEQARMYYLKRMRDNEDEKPYWKVTELEVDDKQPIPAASIMIFSNPDHIIVPTGKFTTIDGGTLLMPDLYVKKSIPIGPNALAFLRVNRYFAPVTHVYAYTADRYATGMRP